MEFTRGLGVKEISVDSGRVELELDANEAHWSTAERLHGGGFCSACWIPPWGEQ